jgi:hypothetical protein
VAGELTSNTAYPTAVHIACLVRHRDFQNRSSGGYVIDLSPCDIGKNDLTYTVHRSQLSYAPPAVYTDLSVAARQAVAIAAFHQWRTSLAVASDDLEAAEQHLWAFATVHADAFDAWYDAHPLTGTLLTEDPPAVLRQFADACGLDIQRLTTAVEALIDITYGGLFSGIESRRSLAELETVLSFTSEQGVPSPPADRYVSSLWIDDDWGRPTEEELLTWRNQG